MDIYHNCFVLQTSTLNWLDWRHSNFANHFSHFVRPLALLAASCPFDDPFHGSLVDALFNSDSLHFNWDDPDP